MSDISPIRARRRLATALAVLTVLLATACSGDDDGDEAATTPTETSPTVPAGITPPGTTLKVGAPATVEYAANPKHTSRIRLTVTRIREGSVKDLKQFTLDRQSKTSGIFYVDAVVRNVGQGDLSGQPLVLYGKVSDELVVPPVSFGSPFPTCNEHPLPKGFTHDKRTSLCLVMFAPDRGTVSEVQWRAPDEEPIAWVPR